MKLTLLESGLIDDCEQGLWKMNHAVQQHVKTLLGKSEQACVESVCAMFRRIMDCFAGRMQLLCLKNRTGTFFAHQQHTGFEDLNIFLHHVAHFIDVVRSHRNRHVNLEGRLLTLKMEALIQMNQLGDLEMFDDELQVSVTNEEEVPLDWDHLDNEKLLLKIKEGSFTCILLIHPVLFQQVSTESMLVKAISSIHQAAVDLPLHDRVLLLTFWLTVIGVRNEPQAVITLIKTLHLSPSGLLREFLLTIDFNYLTCLKVIFDALWKLGRISDAENVVQAQLHACRLLGPNSPAPLAFYGGLNAALIAKKLFCCGQISRALCWADASFSTLSSCPLAVAQSNCIILSAMVIALLSSSVHTGLTLDRQRGLDVNSQRCGVWLSRVQMLRDRHLENYSTDTMVDICIYLECALKHSHQKLGSTASLTLAIGYTLFDTILQRPSACPVQVFPVVLNFLSDIDDRKQFAKVFWLMSHALSNATPSEEMAKLVFVMFMLLFQSNAQSKTTNPAYESLSAAMIAVVTEFHVKFGFLADKRELVLELVSRSAVHSTNVEVKVVQIAQRCQRQRQTGLASRLLEQATRLRNMTESYLYNPWRENFIEMKWDVRSGNTSHRITRTPLFCQTSTVTKQLPKWSYSTFKLYNLKQHQ